MPTRLGELPDRITGENDWQSIAEFESVYCFFAKEEFSGSNYSLTFKDFHISSITFEP